MSNSHPGAILCDADGVVRTWDDASELEAQFGMPSGIIASIAFEPKLLAQANTGVLSNEEWRTTISDRLTRWCGSVTAARAATDRWAAASTVDTEVLRLLEQAARHVPVVLVTNGTTTTEAELTALGITPVVTEIVNSAAIGVAKPEPGIFRHAARVAGVTVERCLFVDDSLRHVHAAERLGMHAVHYRGVADLRAAMEDLLSGLNSGRPHGRRLDEIR